jgi:hypothetical protein
VSFKDLRTIIGAGSSQVTSVEISSVFIPRQESFIDGYLGVKYSVPLASPPPYLITQLASDLTVFQILAEKSGNIPEWMDKRYDRCIKILENLRDGKMVLSSSVTTVGSQGDNFAWSPGMGHHGVFSPVLDGLDQQPDLDRIREDYDERAGERGDVSSGAS